MKWTTLIGATAASACIGLGAHGQATDYTSQSAFDAVAPAASTFGFPGAYPFILEPTDFLYKGVDFVNNVTALDQQNSGVPLTFAVAPSATPTYGQNFLSFQNTQTTISANVTSAYGAFYAIGFSYGSYVSTGGPVTLTLQNTSQFGTFPIESFTVTPTSTAQFVGFTSPTPISSVSIDYPGGYGFDLTSVTQGTAYSLDAVSGTPGSVVYLANGDKLYDEINTSVGGANPSETFAFAEGPSTLQSVDVTETGAGGGGPFTVTVKDSVTNQILGTADFSSQQAADGYVLSLNNSGDSTLSVDPIELTVSDDGSDPNLSITFDTPVSGIGAVPEPSAWVFMLVGVAGLGAALRARPRARA